MRVWIFLKTKKKKNISGTRRLGVLVFQLARDGHDRLAEHDRLHLGQVGRTGLELRGTLDGHRHILRFVFGETGVPGESPVDGRHGADRVPEPRQESHHDVLVVRRGPAGRECD